MKIIKWFVSFSVLMLVSFHAFSSDDEDVRQFKEGSDEIIALSESNDPNLDPLIKQLGKELKANPPRLNAKGESVSYILTLQYQSLVACAQDEEMTDLNNIFKSYVIKKHPKDWRSIVSDKTKEQEQIHTFFTKYIPFKNKYGRCPLVSELK